MGFKGHRLSHYENKEKREIRFLVSAGFFSEI